MGNFSGLDRIIEKYSDQPGKLIPVLHEVQEEIGYLSLAVQQYLAERLKLPLSKIYGVVSFYSFFNTEPRGQHIIGVCMGTACYVKGAGKILEKLKSELAIEMGQTSADQRFTLTITRCLGTCSMAPVLMIDDQLYGTVRTTEVAGILNRY
ncbi:MAG: NAD(P)H-dependent oxidoreductase subunit E [Halanaerobiales bacterium]|nr:NAD(P)H-dependent oxidoreductase subunit E [Halanaerobiales bacterium]